MIDSDITNRMNSMLSPKEAMNLRLLSTPLPL